MKPKKPYKSFPLTPHVRGGWGKKYKGKQLYIPQPDPDEALSEFHRRARAIDAGKAPIKISRPLEAMTVADVCNKYAIERKRDVEAGTLSHGALEDYRAAGRLMAQYLGPDTLADDLTPEHFTAIYRKLQARNLGAHAMARTIQCMRTIWNYADENDWVTRIPKYGSVFKKPITGKKSGKPPTIDQIRSVIAASDGQMRAMILLGLNCAYQAADCAALPRTAIDPAKLLIRFPRVKIKTRTPIDRAATLWGITQEALSEVMSERPSDDLVFRTLHGRPWVRSGFSKKGKGGTIDSVGLMYRRLCESLEPKVSPTRFADLRHVHRTIADELEKPHAAARLMGHRLEGMAQTYVDSIEHGRLEEITDHIFNRIFLDWAMPIDRKAPVRPEPDAKPEKPKPSRRARTPQ
jgi:integrase